MLVERAKQVKDKRRILPQVAKTQSAPALLKAFFATYGRILRWSLTCLARSTSMGEHHVEQNVDERKAQEFMQALLEDLRALAFMLNDDRVERRKARIGAEQEMFLIDRDLRPAPISVDVLQRANEPRLTTEIARFNLEANLTPLDLTGNCFRRMETELQELL